MIFACLYVYLTLDSIFIIVEFHDIKLYLNKAVNIQKFCGHGPSLSASLSLQLSC